MLRTATIAGIALALLALPVAAAEEAAPAGEQAPPIATDEPEVEPMKVTVVSVTGIAGKRLSTSDTDPWQPLQAEDQLSELTIIRTGLGAQVVLDVAGRGRVTVKSATKMGIGQLRMGGDLMEARLGLKYGSMRVTVDAARGTNDLRVATPVGTLAVRGTDGDIAFSGDMGLLLHGTQGTWGVTTRHRSRRVKAGEWTDGKLTPSTDLTGQWRDTQKGDSYGGVTPTEAKELRKNGGGRRAMNLFSPIQGGRSSSARGGGDLDI